MKKILLLPLLDSLPSGHHQAANAIMEYVKNRSTDIECEKVDLMHSWNPFIERVLTRTYLWWIQQFPKSYAWIYQKFAYQANQRSFKHYELLFQKKMKQIIAKEEPDLIVCTHAFPSYLVNNLKRSGACKVPAVNIYTDFFINDVWGIDMMNYHFVSNFKMKFSLMTDHHIPEENIFMTGVPLDESFTRSSRIRKTTGKLNIILAGGSAGLGSILELLKRSRNNQRLNFYILCGNNKQLFHDIKELNRDNFQPLPYLSSREEMSDLYEKADAIITKPGGVTISEAIKKNVPIFIHSALPGQEEINLNHLQEQGLVFSITEEKDIAGDIFKVLGDGQKMKEYQQSLQRYKEMQDVNEPENIFRFIKSILDADSVQTSYKYINEDRREGELIGGSKIK